MLHVCKQWQLFSLMRRAKFWIWQLYCLPNHLTFFLKGLSTCLLWALPYSEMQNKSNGFTEESHEVCNAMVIGQVVTFLKSKIIVNSLHKTYTGLLTSEGTPWVYFYGFDWYSKLFFYTCAKIFLMQVTLSVPYFLNLLKKAAAASPALGSNVKFSTFPSLYTFDRCSITSNPQ